MYLNDIGNVLRAGGSNVQEVSGWQNRNHGQMSAVDSIVVHHTATPLSNSDYPSMAVVRDGRSGLPGPLANLGVGRSGTVYIISNGLAYHAGQVFYTWQDNGHSIGIEVESPGDGTAWPGVQVDAVTRAVAALCKHYGVPVSRVLGHKEVCKPVGRKIDPVGIPGDMPALRALVQKYIDGEVSVPEPSQPVEEENMVKFIRGDSMVKDPDGVPYGYRVFKVEYSGDFPFTAVRTRVFSDQDPGYQVHLRTGGQVYVMPQGIVDAIVYKSDVQGS